MMADVMERRSTRRDSDAFNRVVSEAAAARVVDDIIVDMMQAGMSGKKAKAVARAAQEFLVQNPGFRHRAVVILRGASFTDPEIAEIRELLQELLRAPASQGQAA